MKLQDDGRIESFYDRELDCATDLSDPRDDIQASSAQGLIVVREQIRDHPEHSPLRRFEYLRGRREESMKRDRECLTCQWYAGNFAYPLKEDIGTGHSLLDLVRLIQSEEWESKLPAVLYQIWAYMEEHDQSAEDSLRTMLPLNECHARWKRDYSSWRAQLEAQIGISSEKLRRVGEFPEQSRKRLLRYVEQIRQPFGIEDDLASDQSYEDAEEDLRVFEDVHSGIEERISEGFASIIRMLDNQLHRRMRDQFEVEEGLKDEGFWCLKGLNQYYPLGRRSFKAPEGLSDQEFEDCYVTWLLDNVEDLICPSFQTETMQPLAAYLQRARETLDRLIEDAEKGA